MKQLNIFERFLDWALHFIANHIPETSKRFVLYELQHRHMSKRMDCHGYYKGDEWEITFGELYKELRD